MKLILMTKSRSPIFTTVNSRGAETFEHLNVSECVVRPAHQLRWLQQTGDQKVENSPSRSKVSKAHTAALRQHLVGLQLRAVPPVQEARVEMLCMGDEEGSVDLERVASCMPIAS